METELGPEFETKLDNHEKITAMNKNPCWQLKGIVSQISLKLFLKYMADYCVRSGNAKSQTGNKQLD